jgi:hypothetical protein
MENAMTDARSTHVLLVLSAAPLPVRQDSSSAMRALADVMRLASCQEMHLMHIREIKTPTFAWPLLMEYRLPEEPDEQAKMSRVNSLRSTILARCPWVGGDRARFLSLTQTGFGLEQNGADVIVSLYRWTYAYSPDERDRNMWIHFEMERAERDYSAVHFNVSNGKQYLNNEEFDFVFQAYVNDPRGLARIYSSDSLEIMREHSQTFLDTDTRRLAFGKVQIVKGPGATS